MHGKPLLFTTIKWHHKELKAPFEHIEKLKKDYFALHQEKLDLTIDDLTNFIEEKQSPSGTWRLNIYTSKPLRFKLTQEKEPPPSTYSLKMYPTPFYEPLAHFKKEDFSLRKQLLALAQEKGADDWIFFDNERHFLETTICNLFWICENSLFTPSCRLPLYMGVTLQNVIRAAKQMGYEINKVYEKNKETLLNSFVFVTNSMKGLVPVNKIDNHEMKVDLKLAEKLSSQMADLKFFQDVL